MNELWKKQAIGLALVILTLIFSVRTGYASFVSGSLIGISGGFKAIEQMTSAPSVLVGTLAGEGQNTTVSWTSQFSLRSSVPITSEIAMVYIQYGGGKELIVTPDQVFMLTDGTLYKALDLFVEASLLQADGSEAKVESVTFGSYEGGVYHLMIVGTYTGTPNGHLLNVNGLVAGDYVLCINTNSSFEPGSGAFPPLPSPALLGDVSLVTMEDGAQQFPDTAYNSVENNYLAVWEHAVFEDLYEIRGAVLDGESGAPVGDPAVLLLDEFSIEAPEIVYNGKANEYLLVARRKNDNMVLGQRVSAQGQPVGEPVEIGPSGGPTFFDPASRARVASVAYNAQEDRYAVAFGEPISVQILMPDLSPDWIGEPLGDGSNPSVAWSSKSNVYLMAYEDREIRSTGSENLSAVAVDNFAEAASDIVLVRDQEFAEESPRVAYNPDDDQFLIVWDERIGFSENLTPQTLTDTIGQIVGADGIPVGEPIPIEAGTAYTLRQDVDYNPASQVYLVVWKGDGSGDFAFADILGQFVNRDGSLNGSTFLIYDNGDDNDNTDLGTLEQYYDESKLPAVTANTSTGEFLVVWEEGGVTQTPEARDILSRSAALASTAVADWEVY